MEKSLRRANAAEPPCISENLYHYRSPFYRVALLEINSLSGGAYWLSFLSTVRSYLRVSRQGVDEMPDGVGTSAGPSHGGGAGAGAAGQQTVTYRHLLSKQTLNVS